MSTSGGGLLNAILYLTDVALAVQLALALNGRTRVEQAPPGLGPGGLAGAAAIWLVVAVPSTLQFPFPGVLHALSRDPGLIKSGQVWRLLTSMVVQDGGIPGTAFNLVILAVVVPIAMLAWGPGMTLTLLLGSQLIFGSVVTFAWPSSGAGNSAATLGLAASLAGLVLTRSWPPLARDRALAGRALGVLLCGVVLVAIADAHGLAILAGTLLGAIAEATDAST